MKITKSQLKEIIKEEVSRLQKKTILENRRKEIARELRMLNEEVEGDKSILEALYIKLPFLKDGNITEDEWSFLKKYGEFLNDVNSKEDYINYLSKVSDESYDQENIETLHSYKAFDTLEDAVKLIVKEINPKFDVWFSENVELRDGNDKNVLTISDENDNLTKIPVIAKLSDSAFNIQELLGIGKKKKAAAEEAKKKADEEAAKKAAEEEAANKKAQAEKEKLEDKKKVMNASANLEGVIKSQGHYSFNNPGEPSHISVWEEKKKEAEEAYKKAKDFYKQKYGEELNEGTMKITKSQLKEIIKEEVTKLQKKTILENRKKEITRELRALNLSEAHDLSGWDGAAGDWQAAKERHKDEEPNEWDYWVDKENGRLLDLDRSSLMHTDFYKTFIEPHVELKLIHDDEFKKLKDEGYVFVDNRNTIIDMYIK